jgi:hypothetical protein
MTAVPALLCVVAVYHIYLVQSTYQSPWKGGGFGMFSSVISPSSRVLHVYRLTEKGEIPVPPHPRQARRVFAVLTAPTSQRVRELAGKLIVPSATDESEKSNGLRLEVVQENFDPLHMTLATEPLLEVNIERPDL